MSPRSDFTDGVWYRHSSITGGYAATNVGFYEGDVGTPMDIDGDGRLDLIYYKGFTGAWYGLRSSVGNGIYVEWGLPGDVPVPVDFDGDGLDNLALWRPSDGAWWIKSSVFGPSATYPFGLAGDIPVGSAFTR